MLRPMPVRRLHRERGLSLIELMIGIAIGLVIVAAASLVMTSQLVENRRLVTETQVQQDLRAATDMMARELRRVGYNSEPQILSTLWYPGAPGPASNSFAASLTVVSGTKVDFNYFPGAVSVPGPFGFERQGNVIKTVMGGTQQELTDPNVMTVTALTSTVSTDSSAAIVMPCVNPCPLPFPIAGDATSCWPTYRVRKASIGVQAQARSDANVKRTIDSAVRVRNDYVVFFNAASILICPA